MFHIIQPRNLNLHRSKLVSTKKNHFNRNRNLISVPAALEKLSDDVAYLEVLKDAYAQIAFLLRLDDEDLRLQICNTLLEVFLGTQLVRSKSCKKKAETGCQADESHRRVSVEYTRYVFEECQVADTLVRALALFESAAVINILFQVRKIYIKRN